jgi:hypothetical protein
VPGQANKTKVGNVVHDSLDEDEVRILTLMVTATPEDEACWFQWIAFLFSITAVQDTTGLAPNPGASRASGRAAVRAGPGITERDPGLCVIRLVGDNAGL